MGKSLPSAKNLQQFARFIASPNNGPRRPAQLRPVSKPQPLILPSPVTTGSGPGSRRSRLETRRMDPAESSEERRRRMPLKEVVADCVQRWFHDTLKEAKNGDTAMQVLVGQMYCSGYGVARDAQRGKAWISRASKSRASVWKVGDKHPGYHASDSDSDDAKEVAK